jgi:hypothetical protein
MSLNKVILVDAHATDVTKHLRFMWLVLVPLVGQVCRTTVMRLNDVVHRCHLDDEHVTAQW